MTNSTHVHSTGKCFVQNRSEYTCCVYTIHTDQRRNRVNLTQYAAFYLCRRHRTARGHGVHSLPEGGDSIGGHGVHFIPELEGMV
jgi:hypothetical protein